MDEADNREIHRIGGASVESLRIKQREAALDPPGISVLKAGSPGDAATQMRAGYPDATKATKLHELAKTVASTTEALIKSVGFDVIPTPSRRLPTHHRIIHPNGVAGFTDENLARLAAVFVISEGH